MNCPVEIRRAHFDGAILKRGFWLYVWKVTDASRTVVYVGRTGDSSSANASSPFSRLSAHLAMKSTAKANSMYRQLQKIGIDPTAAEFSLIAVGPLFREQRSFADHQPFRDRMAGMEAALANELYGRGYAVVGNHSTKHPVSEHDREVFEEIVAGVAAELGSESIS